MTPTMTFGHYKGKKLYQIPAGYLLYLYRFYRIELSKPIKVYIKENKQALEAREEKEKDLTSYSMVMKSIIMHQDTKDFDTIPLAMG